jgi:hypothetical protein
MREYTKSFHGGELVDNLGRKFFSLIDHIDRKTNQKIKK